MHAPLVFVSASHNINLQKVFKIAIAKAFNLSCNIPMLTGVGEPILEY
jgi:GTP-binding protein of the ras superfamily involved in termination of M-phase